MNLYEVKFFYKKHIWNKRKAYSAYIIEKNKVKAGYMTEYILKNEGKNIDIFGIEACLYDTKYKYSYLFAPDLKINIPFNEGHTQ